jgi:hypothetical protein
MADHTPTPALDVNTDAKSRAARTFLTGLGWDVIIALATALLLWLPDADLTSKEAWLVLGTAVAKTVLTAAGSYVLRYKVTPPAPVNPGDGLIDRPFGGGHRPSEGE